MIFVTVGTTEFDELIKCLDNLISEKKILGEFTAQIGLGKYAPKHMESFSWVSFLDVYLIMSDLIISHAGASTIFECLELRKKLIVVENPNVRRPANELLKKLSSKNYLIWCKRLEDLYGHINNVDTFPFREYTAPGCQIAEKILEFLGV